MFKKFTTILNQAVEAIANPLPLQGDFQYHWHSITSYFLDKKDKRDSIEDTNIVSHLDQMLSILVEEETTSDSGSTGPCMEFLLQHNLLDALYALGRTDSPPGMKQEVLLFVTKFLNRTQQPLLPHVNVHQPVYRLIGLCGEIRASPTEIQEIKFLCTICAKLKADPYLVNFFIEVPKTEKQSKAADNQSKFFLVDSLLKLSCSEDSRVAVKACEGLMLCASLTEDKAATCLVKHTQFCKQLATRFVQLYNKLPKNMEPQCVGFTEANWGLDSIDGVEDMTSFPGKRQLVSFLSWLDYCDQLIQMCHPLIAKSLSSTIRCTFLEKCLHPQLLHTCEASSLTAMTILNRCLNHITSPLLIDDFAEFILGQESKPEKQGSCQHLMWENLLQKCNHISEEISLASLKLIDCLLRKANGHILHCLVLKNLLGRLYALEQTPLINGHVSQTDEEEDFNVSSGLNDSIHSTVDRFLSIVPEKAKSCHQLGDSGYDMYLRDAHDQFHAIQTQCNSYNWPQYPVTESEHRQETFYEGGFLSMMFDRISHLLDQSYEMNLQLTSMLSRLALLPHPNLHEYLLNPRLHTKPGVRTLHSIFEKVVADLEVRMKLVSDFELNLVEVRKQLMAEPSIIRIHNSRLYEGVIILEEFCKELAAIAFVKHQALN